MPLENKSFKVLRENCKGFTETNAVRQRVPEIGSGYTKNQTGGLGTWKLKKFGCGRVYRSQPHYGLHPAMFSGDDSLVLLVSITRY